MGRRAAERERDGGGREWEEGEETKSMKGGEKPFWSGWQARKRIYGGKAGKNRLLQMDKEMQKATKRINVKTEIFNHKQNRIPQERHSLTDIVVGSKKGDAKNSWIRCITVDVMYCESTVCEMSLSLPSSYNWRTWCTYIQQGNRKTHTDIQFHFDYLDTHQSKLWSCVSPLI